MRTAWDEAKNTANRAKHGIGFEAMEGFDWDFAALLDAQTVDGEARELWAGPVDTLLVAVVVTERIEDGEDGQEEIVLRIISLRRATNTEKALWRKEFHHG